MAKRCSNWRGEIERVVKLPVVLVAAIGAFFLTFIVGMAYGCMASTLAERKAG